MNKRVEIGLKLKKFAEKNYSSLVEFAEKMGKGSTFFTRYFNGTSVLGGELLSELREKSDYKLDLNWLLTGGPNDDAEGSISINYEEKYSGNSQSFAGDNGASQSESPAMQGNFIGEPREINYYQSFDAELTDKITEPYKEIINMLKQQLSEREQHIKKLEKILEDKNP
ncbi:MAG: hypothetical protein ACYC56_04235 [Candidatus Aquicultor sp.]